jgi:hypothetical protein
MNGDTFVRPGDLISAELWNSLVVQLQDLSRRVQDLEAGQGGSGLAITEVRFTSPLRVGSQVTILGRSFGVAQVFVDQVPVTNFSAGTSNTQLVFIVPNLPNLTSARPATFRVLNPATGESDSRDLIVFPREDTVEGNVFLEWLDASPSTIQPGQAARFFYSVRSEATASASFVIAPVLNGPNWSVQMEVLDQNGAVLPGGLLALNPRETKPMSVRFTIPTNTNGTTFRVGVSAANQGRTMGTSALTQFIVGQPVPSADPTIHLSFSDVNVEPITDTASGLQGTLISVRPGTLITVAFLLTFDSVGEYDVSVSLSSGTNNWTSSVQGNILHYSVTTANLAQVRRPRFVVGPQAGATATGEVVFQVRRVNDARSQTRRFNLALLPNP